MTINKPPASRLPAALLLLSLLLCATAAQARREVMTFEIEGVTRRVLTYLPSRPAPGEVPVVIVFHGRGDDSGKFANAVKLHRDWPEAIVAYPRGEKIDTSPPMRGWQYRAGTYQDRDLKLTDQLLQALAGRYRISPQRTFAAGFSNGGHFLFLLMKERSEQFAAFAIIGALQPKFEAPTPPRPLLYLFGRDEGPQYRQDWEHTVKALARHNRVRNQDQPYLSCCRMLEPHAGGAEMAYGSYNAGHIWPYQGNEWIRDFFQRSMIRSDEAAATDAAVEPPPP